MLSHPPGRPIWTPAIENGDVAPVHSDRSGARTDLRKTAIAAPLGEVLAITTLDRAALYSDVSAQDAFPWLQGEAAERAASVYTGRQRPEMLIERQRFAAAVKGARIAAWPGHHYEFLRAPDATARLVREFLVSLQ